MNNRIYKSKVDLWLALIVIAAGVLVLGGTIQLLLSEGLYHPATLALLLCSIFLVAVIFGLAYPVSYEISQTELIIRSGLTKSSIELSTIESVKPSRDPSSSPAWSLDRLRIDYHKQGKLTFILISPDDKSAFLNELEVITKNLSPRGDKITRQSQ
ncbi:MAG: PH domain-containing protein [candidate division Zixibacteria bacterium]|nr:PH domain-containing protein [candidate division Zixibacteria bacterium]